jgi:hypothetical protein
VLTNLATNAREAMAGRGTSRSGLTHGSSTSRCRTRAGCGRATTPG